MKKTLALVLIAICFPLQAAKKDFVNYVNTLQGTNSRVELTRGFPVWKYANETSTRVRE
nr:hypothetical protein [uncultured Macellibacteroides sp.]